MARISNPLISEYLQRHRLPAPADGQEHVTIMVDDRYRIRLAQTPGGTVALASRLCPLESSGHARDEQLAMLARLALGMMHRHDSSCAIDPAEESVWLQQIISANSNVSDMEEAMGSFVNALSFWSNAIRQIA